MNLEGMKGQPDNWNERHESKLTNYGKVLILPDGAKFYSTPSHGYLQVDTSKLPAKISGYDYWEGPHSVLLEEDCSVTMWLAEMGLIPMEPYIERMITEIQREPIV